MRFCPRSCGVTVGVDRTLPDSFRKCKKLPTFFTFLTWFYPLLSLMGIF